MSGQIIFTECEDLCILELYSSLTHLVFVFSPQLSAIVNLVLFFDWKNNLYYEIFYTNYQ